jgi:HAD superfamily hydrolase (TIGR01662 family)
MNKKESGETESLAPGAGEAGSQSTPSLHPLIKDARAILFDAGGTLAQPDWERIVGLAEKETGRIYHTSEMGRHFAEALRAVDGRLSEEPVRAHTRRPGWVFLDVFSALGVEREACGRLVSQVLTAHGEKHIWCGLDTDVPRVIAGLKRAGLKVGVISNTEDGRLEEMLKLLEIATDFDLLVDSHLVGLRKPDAAIFHYALEQLGVEPGDAVYIGDSYGHDVLGAKNAGLRAILLDPLDLYIETDCPRIHRLSELTEPENE